MAKHVSPILVFVATTVLAVSLAAVLNIKVLASGIGVGRGGQARSQQAGKVSAAIPEESVQRLGQGTEIDLKLSDSVNWLDVVRTLQVGRVRIELLDGSFLNIGARSIMRIVKHDAQSQQTEIELNFGRMRVQAVRLSRSGASFQVKTPTAVIGVVGTDFIVNVTETGTEVFVIEGAVVVANLLAGVVGQVTVHAGEHAAVLSGQPPSQATSASQSDLQAQMDQTKVASPPIAGAGGGGKTGGGHTGLFLLGGLAAAGGIAAAAGLAAQQGQNAQNCQAPVHCNAILPGPPGCLSGQAFVNGLAAYCRCAGFPSGHDLGAGLSCP